MNTKTLWVVVRRTTVTVGSPHVTTPVTLDINTPWYWVNDHIIGAGVVDCLNDRETDPDYSFVLMPNTDTPAGH